MKRSLEKLLAIVLSVALCLGSFVLPAFAEEILPEEPAVTTEEPVVEPVVEPTVEELAVLEETGTEGEMLDLLATPSMTFAPASLSLKAGATGIVVVTTSNENAVKIIGATSSKSAVATVTFEDIVPNDDDITEPSHKVTVTAVSAGTATITVKDANNKTATFAVTVADAPASVAISGGRAIGIIPDVDETPAVGETLQLTATVKGVKGATLTGEIATGAWSVKSGSESVLSVSAAGLVTALDVGTGTVQFTTDTNAKVGECDITVKKVIDAPMTVVAIAPMSVGETPAVVFGDIGEAYYTKLEYKIADETVAKMSSDNAKVQALAAGTTTLIVTPFFLDEKLEDLASDPVNITVTDSPVSTIEFAKATMALGFPATYAEVDTANKNVVTFGLKEEHENDPIGVKVQSSNETIAIAAYDKANKQVIVTPKKVGKASITLSVLGTLLTKKFDVTVAAYPDSAKLSVPVTLGMAQGETLTVKATEYTGKKAVKPASNKGAWQPVDENDPFTFDGATGLLTAKPDGDGPGTLVYKLPNEAVATSTITVNKAPANGTTNTINVTVPVGSVYQVQPLYLDSEDENPNKVACLNNTYTLPLDKTSKALGTFDAKTNKFTAKKASSTATYTIEVAPKIEGNTAKCKVVITVVATPVIRIEGGMKALTLSAQKISEQDLNFESQTVRVTVGSDVEYLATDLMLGKYKNDIIQVATAAVAGTPNAFDVTIKALKKGSTTISFGLLGTKAKTVALKVTVGENAPNAVALSKTAMSIGPGESFDLTWKTLLGTKQIKNVVGTWTVTDVPEEGNEPVAKTDLTVQNGVVTAQNGAEPGDYRVTFTTYNGVSGSCTVTVNEAATIQGFTVPDLSVGMKAAATVTKKDNAVLAYKAMTKTIAVSIDKKNGNAVMVTGKAVGAATVRVSISAKAYAVGDVYKDFNLNNIQQKPDGIKLYSDAAFQHEIVGNFDVTIGQTTPFYVKADNGSPVTCTYSSMTKGTKITVSAAGVAVPATGVTADTTAVFIVKSYTGKKATLTVKAVAAPVPEPDTTVASLEFVNPENAANPIIISSTPTEGEYVADVEVGSYLIGAIAKNTDGDTLSDVQIDFAKVDASTTGTSNFDQGTKEITAAAVGDTIGLTATYTPAEGDPIVITLTVTVIAAP